jgi:hypothetical protein
MLFLLRPNNYQRKTTATIIRSKHVFNVSHILEANSTMTEPELADISALKF